MKLQTRYTMAIVALIIAIVAVLSLLLQFRTLSADMSSNGALSMERNLVAQMRHRGRASAEYLAESLQKLTLVKGNVAAHELLNATLNQSDVKSVYIYDRDHNIFFDAAENIERYGQPIEPWLGRAPVANTKDYYQYQVGDKLLAFHSIYLDETYSGGVVIEFSLQRLAADIETIQQSMDVISEEGLAKTVYTVLITTMVLIFASIFVSLPVTRSLVRPIKKLSEFADDIGHGNYDVDLHIEREDELGDLAHAFEEMSHNLQKTNDQMRHIAYHDELTGLPNRRMFQDYLRHAIAKAKRQEERFAVLFIDLDDFKRVNDTLGHDIGDDLLRGVAKRIKDSVRDSDYVTTVSEETNRYDVARLGGDEFTVLLPNINQSIDAAIVARRIIKSVSASFSLSGHEIVVGASIGITMYPSDGEDEGALVKNSDIAMYQAKENGKNQYQYFSANMNARAFAKLSIESDLRKALSHNQFSLFYQPKIDMSTGQVVSAEALIRWHHMEKGWISPASFIPIAEDTGLILPIGEWIIETAARDIKFWKKRGISSQQVAVNVSSVQLCKQNVYELCWRNICDYHIEPGNLSVEITETALIQNESETKKVLHRLREAGFDIWLDDFGTGYSSLGYLRKLPVSGVKIDCSFVREIERSPSDQALTSAIIAMAHNLNLKVVAEGIETVEQAIILADQGCDYGQGYFYSRPMPAEEFFKLMSMHNVPWGDIHSAVSDVENIVRH